MNNRKATSTIRNLMFEKGYTSYLKILIDNVRNNLPFLNFVSG